MNSEPPDALSANFFFNLFAQIPVLVLRLTPEGLVLAANPEAVRVTGYEARDLIGRNFWGLLFPGKLFQQVPKFLASVQSGASVRDRPMVMCTKSGRECVVAWSRFANQGPDGKVLEIVCTGVDLTQRLIDSDRPALPQITVDPLAGDSFPNSIEGDFVLPLVVSPPAADHRQSPAAGEVENFLVLVEQRGNVLTSRLAADLDFTSALGCQASHVALTGCRLHIDGLQNAVCEVARNIQSVRAMCGQHNSNA